MVKISIFYTGKIKDKHILSLINEISKRLQRVKIIELKECKGKNTDEVKLKEYELFEPIFDKFEKVFVCSEKGIEYTTYSFYDKFKTFDEVAFIISGAFGPHQKLIDKSNGLISLSQMTFTHELALFMLVEQCYRIECFKNNIDYTK